MPIIRNPGKARYKTAHHIRQAFDKLVEARQHKGISLCRAAQKAGIPVYLLKQLEENPGVHCKAQVLFALCSVYSLQAADLFRE
ncbi:MAG TPA: hypothetical protein VFW07_00420 [Parafilimonas sp.]|nr:hypothetical protein [Parafilimonas sp.]